MVAKKSGQEKLGAEAKIQELLADARDTLMVAEDLARQHHLPFKFIGIEFDPDADELKELNANEKSLREDLRDAWNDSGCTDW